MRLCCSAELDRLQKKPLIKLFGTKSFWWYAEKGELRFPVWQFKEGGGVLEGFAEALAELGRSHAGEDVEAFAFWLNLNPVTGGLRPIDALREGKIKDILRAAEAAPY